MTKREILNIIKYLKTTGRFSNNFTGYSMLYSMTTENISGFINKYDLKGKRVLTVAGSGDQRLNCFLNGASDVTCFDVNPVAELHLKLKDTAIEELDYLDFLKFFGVRFDDSKTNSFNSIIFDKLNDGLDDDAYLLYDFLINDFSRPLFGYAYYDFDYKYSKMREFSNYITRDNYERVASIVDRNRLSFMNVNVANLPEVLDGEKFDMILLSNISDYIHLFYPDNQMQRYKELIDQLVDNLYDGGTIQLGYIYASYIKGSDVSKFHFDESRNKVFPFIEYPITFVNSFYGDGRYDKVITYKKKC